MSNKTGDFFVAIATYAAAIVFVLYVLGFIIFGPSLEKAEKKVTKSHEEAKLELLLSPVYEFLNASVRDSVAQVNVENQRYIFKPKGVVFRWDDYWLANPTETDIDNIRFIVPDVKPLLRTLEEIVLSYPERSFPFKRCLIYIEFDRKSFIFNGRVVVQGQYDHVESRSFILLPFHLSDAAMEF